MNTPNDLDKNNNIETNPTNKVPIREDNLEYYEIEKNKDYIISKFGGTNRTVLSTVISSIYTLAFLVLLAYYNEKHYDKGKDFSIGECNKLKRWNRVIYIGLGVSFIFFIICTILQIMNKEKEKYVAILLLIRTLFNYNWIIFFNSNNCCIFYNR